MKFKINNPNTKRGTKVCPRCKTKCLINQVRCPECRLIFSRLNNLSNKEAKKAIRRGEKIKVVYVKELPYDVSKWKTFFLCLFLGIFGAHNYYVGRYKKALFISFTMLFSIGILALNMSATAYGTLWYDILFYCFAPFGSCILLFWGFDMFSILFERYKVPGAIPFSVQQANAKEMLGIDKATKILEEKQEKTTEKNKISNEKDEILEKQVEPQQNVQKKQPVKNSKYTNYNNTKKKGKKK